LTFPLNVVFCFVEFECAGEVDDTSNSDQYELEDIEVNLSDYIRGTLITNFEESWEQLGPQNDSVETFNLSSAKSLQGQNRVDSLLNSHHVEFLFLSHSVLVLLRNWS
jgi:hypothetical protein